MKKAALVFAVIFTAAMLLSGCSLNAKPSEPKELTVYVLNINPKRWIECDVWSYNFPDFQKEHDDISIEAVEFSNIDALNTQIEEDVKSGKGPDLIFYSWQNSFDISKMAANGLFFDLNIYLKDDTSFDRADYIESLLDTGVFEGAQYLMPVGYFSPVLLTSEEKLAAAGVEYEGRPYSGRELMELIQSEGERLAGDADHYAFIDFQQGNSSTSFLDYSGVIAPDYESRTVSFDPDTLFACMQLNASFIGELRNSLNALTNSGPGTGYRDTPETLLEKGTFFHETFAPFKEMLQYAFYLQYLKNETPVLQFQTSFDSADAYYVDPLYAAVNRNCAEPEAAYELIRYLMDHPVRQGADGIAPESYFSINKSVSAAYLQSVFDTLNPTDSEAWQVVEEQFTLAFDQFQNSEVGCGIPSTLSKTIFGACLTAAEESRTAFDDAWSTLQPELNAYFTE